MRAHDPTSPLKDNLTIQDGQVALDVVFKLGNRRCENIGGQNREVRSHAGQKASDLRFCELRIRTAICVSMKGILDRKDLILSDDGATFRFARDHGKQIFERVSRANRRIRARGRITPLAQPSFHRISGGGALRTEIFHVEIAKLLNECRLRNRQNAGSLHPGHLRIGQKSAVLDPMPSSSHWLIGTPGAFDPGENLFNSSVADGMYGQLVAHLMVAA
jgi:hypothetical protein